MDMRAASVADAPNMLRLQVDALAGDDAGKVLAAFQMRCLT